MHCMLNNKSLGLALTTYNRAERVIPFLKNYQIYPEIDEIIITDDCSNDYGALIKESWDSKVQIHNNQVNLQAYQNKLKTLQQIKSDWCILFDSDNFFNFDYINALNQEDLEYGLDENIVYCPSAALPNFIYTHLENKIIDKNFWNENHINEGCCFNTGNMVLSKKAINCLLENFKTDSIKNPFVECKYMNYIFIKNNFKLKIVKNMTYQHAISNDSFYMLHSNKHTEFDRTFNWIL